MKNIFFTLTLIVAVNLSVFSQSNSSTTWTISEINQANTFAGTQYSQEEQEVALLCNLARLDGQKFANTFVKGYFGNKSTSTLNQLKADLSKVKNRQMLQPDYDLCRSSAYHAEDMGNSGNIGHNSTNGQSMSDRVWSYAPSMNAIAENCSYGYQNAIDIVMQLLEDEGVAGAGHRVNILNEKYGSVGISIKPHKGYRYNCVMDFGNKVGNVPSKDNSVISIDQIKINLTSYMNGNGSISEQGSKTDNSENKNENKINKDDTSKNNGKNSNNSKNNNSHQQGNKTNNHSNRDFGHSQGNQNKNKHK